MKQQHTMKPTDKQMDKKKWTNTQTNKLPNTLINIKNQYKGHKQTDTEDDQKTR